MRKTRQPGELGGTWPNLVRAESDETNQRAGPGMKVGVGGVGTGIQDT